ncbi:MAG: hypothetical protein KGZ83_02190 [Sulfuricella sp.]|nr:hypothetical protein [Sulfuricella sp.]
MNQSFKKKMVVASVAAAFSAVGTGFVAVPMVAPMGAASANQFEDTTQAVGTSSGVNVSVGSSVVANNQSVTITESVGGAIGPIGGNIYLALDNGAKFAAGTKIGLPNKVLAFTTMNGNAVAANTVGSEYSVVAADVDSSGRIPLTVSALSVAGTPSFIVLSNITMNTSSSTVGSSVNVSIASASTAVGVTTGTNSYVATVASKGATIALNTTSANNVAASQTLTPTQINIAETVPGSFTNNTSTADVTLTLNGGYTWATKPTVAVDSGTDPIDGAGKVSDGSGTGNSTTIAAYQFETSLAASTTTPYKIKSTGGSVFVPAGSAAGNVTVTVKVYSGNAVISQSDVVIGAVVAKGTTTTFVEATSGGTTDYDTCFTGRTYTALSGCVGAEADTMKIAELVGGSLAANGSLSLTMSNGVKLSNATTSLTSTDTTISIGTETVATDSKSASYTIATASTTTAGNTVITFGDLDFTSATVGDMNVTIGGSAGASAQTVKMAEIANATNASVASGASTITAGSTFTIPEIAITEGKYSALAAANVIGIALPTGYTIQKASGDALTGDTLTNATDVTVKVYDAAGTDVTTTAIGSSPTITVKDGGSGTPRELFITVSGASNSTSGSYTYKVTGLKVKSSSSATAGAVNAIVAGASSAGTSTVAVMGGEDSSVWTSKAGATKQTLAVATIGSSTVGTPTAAATGTITSQNISVGYVPAGNDLSKQGSVFVAAVVPTSSGIGGVYFMDSKSGWTLFTTCTTAPSYFTGTLAAVSSFNLLPAAADLTVLKGTQIYVGHGVGGALSPAGTACNSMLNSGTYNLAYTIN